MPGPFRQQQPQHHQQLGGASVAATMSGPGYAQQMQGYGSIDQQQQAYYQQYLQQQQQQQQQQQAAGGGRGAPGASVGYGQQQPMQMQASEGDVTGPSFTSDGQGNLTMLLGLSDSLIGCVLGRGGSVIKDIMASTGTVIHIAQKDDYLPGLSLSTYLAN